MRAKLLPIEGLETPCSIFLLLFKVSYLSLHDFLIHIHVVKIDGQEDPQSSPNDISDPPLWSLHIRP